jgi:HSP20 family protein
MDNSRRTTARSTGGASALGDAAALVRNTLQARLLVAGAVTDAVSTTFDALGDRAARSGPSALARLERSAQDRARLAEDLAGSLSSARRDRGATGRPMRVRSAATGARRDRDEPAVREVVLRPTVREEETDDAYRFLVELPGVAEGSLLVEVDDREIYVEAERADDEDVVTVYSRTFRLPREAEASEASAELGSGVLTVEVPKPVDARRRRLDVGGAARTETRRTRSGSSSAAGSSDAKDTGSK